MDAISRLEKYPHLLDDIFLNLSRETLLKVDEIWPSWEMMANCDYFWKKRWLKNLADLPTWRTLVNRMEYANPELFIRIIKGNVGIYRYACDYVEQNMQRVCKFNMKKPQLLCKLDISAFKVNGSHIFIADSHVVLIINRWTGKFVKELRLFDNYLMRSTATDLQLNDQLLAVKLLNGQIRIYNLADYELVGVLNDATDGFPYSAGFHLGDDILISSNKSLNRKSLSVQVRQLNSSTGHFVLGENRIFVVDFGRSTFKEKIYCDPNYVIIDVNCAVERVITVFDRQSLNQVRQRKVPIGKLLIKRQCHNGVIIIDTAAWHIDRDVIEPIVDDVNIGAHLYSAVLDHFPDFKFVLRRDPSDYVALSVLPIDSRKSSQMPFSSVPSYMILPGVRYLKSDKCFFDGVQLFYHFERQMNVVNVLL